MPVGFGVGKGFSVVGGVVVVSGGGIDSGSVTYGGGFGGYQIKHYQHNQ